MFPTEGLAKVQLTDGRRWPRRVLVDAGLIAVAAGVTTLLFGTETASPHRVALDLSPAGALGLALGGLAVLLASPTAPTRWLPAIRWSSRALGAATVATAALALAQDAVGRPARATPPAAGVALLLCGLALTTLDTFAGRADLLAPAAVLVAPAGMRGQLPTLAVVALLGVAVILARPDRGLARILTTGGPAGIMARYLIPVAGVLALGAIVAVPLVAVALALYLVALVAAGALDRDHDRRQRLVAVLREERNFGATLLQSMNDAVMVHDTVGQIVDVNPRWCALVGRERENLVGLCPPYPWQTDPDPAYEPEPMDTERLVRRADGALVPVLATTAPVPDGTGRPRAYVASYTDISERVRAEEALAVRAAELQEANHDLRRVNQQLADAVGFKSDLIDMVSHELSQPLSSVVSLAELLVTDWTSLAEDIRFDLATKIDRNTGRLTSMINDLMLLFRLDAGVVTARRLPVPVLPLVDAVIDRVASNVDVVSFVEPDLSVLVDREHLWQVLVNLLTNAAQFGAPPFEVSARRRPDGVVLAVRDHGAGIPQELVPQLFQRFTRARAIAAGGRRGAGLGLFIAAHLARVNGGDIWYEPVLPHGACLLVRLPSAESSRVRAEGAAESSRVRAEDAAS
ncbi:MAG: two-component system, OmpR family, sensor histidine kinase KdpD [Micromonosporaceae bacterium]